MSNGKKKNNDDLRPHYDLSELEVVRYGPGWAERSDICQDSNDEISHHSPASDLLSSASIDKQLLLDFFVTFARVEYALKRAGYVSKNGRPTIRWNEFAKDIESKLLNSTDVSVRQAIKYLQQHPPKKQVMNDGELVFQEPESASSDSQFVIDAVKTVRNTLFHGGKEIAGSLAERDRLLLRSCLDILGLAIRLDKDVLGFYEEQPPEVDAA